MHVSTLAHCERAGKAVAAAAAGKVPPMHS